MRVRVFRSEVGGNVLAEFDSDYVPTKGDSVILTGGGRDERYRVIDRGVSASKLRQPDRAAVYVVVDEDVDEVSEPVMLAR